MENQNRSKEDEVALQALREMIDMCCTGNGLLLSAESVKNADAQNIWRHIIKYRGKNRLK